VAEIARAGDRDDYGAGHRKHETGELQRPQRLVQQNNRERHREQRREVAERRGDDGPERAVRGKGEKRQAGRKEQSDGDKDR